MPTSTIIKSLKIPRQGKHRVSGCYESTGSKLPAWEKRGAFSKGEKGSIFKKRKEKFLKRKDKKLVT